MVSIRIKTVSVKNKGSESMNDIVARSRVPRQNIHARRRKKYGTKESTKYQDILFRQTFAAVLILLVAVAVKNIPSVATEYLRNQAHRLVTSNIEVKKLYQGIEDFFSRLTANKSSDKTGLQDVTDADTEDLAAVGVYSVKMMMPVEGPVSSVFGERLHPVKNEMVFHSGIDIDGNDGDAIRAALGGTVTDEGEKPEYGKYVRIQHADGFVTVYAHCSSIDVKAGDVIKQGDVIAKVGETGNAIGTHLHFEVWKDGKALDPLEFIQMQQDSL